MNVFELFNMHYQPETDVGRDLKKVVKSIGEAVEVPRQADCPNVSDTELLDWAITHPEVTVRAINSYWASCGRGCRETRFDFRQIIKAARQREEYRTGNADG